MHLAERRGTEDGDRRIRPQAPAGHRPAPDAAEKRQQEQSTAMDGTGGQVRMIESGHEAGAQTVR